MAAACLTAFGVDGGPLGAGCEHDEPKDAAHDGVDNQLWGGPGGEFAAVEGGLDDGLARGEAGPDDVLDHVVEVRGILSGLDEDAGQDHGFGGRRTWR